MSKKTVIAIHEIATTKTRKGIKPPGTEFSTEDHAELVARGAAKYPDPEPEEGASGEGTGGEGTGGEGTGGQGAGGEGTGGEGTGGEGTGGEGTGGEGTGDGNAQRPLV